jgi:uncharacterized membrane protein YhhN
MDNLREEKMDYRLFILGLAVGVLNWVSSEKKWKTIEYITKPAVILIFLLWLWTNGALHGVMLWFGLGLVFSLAGDIFLMLPKNFFLPGLVAFLLAHIMYLIGFNLSVTTISIPILFVALAFLWVAYLVFRRLLRGLSACGEDKLKLPVTIYATVISLMTISAMFTLANPAWSLLHAAIVTCGALLFFISDSLLAWNKFCAPSPHVDLLVMATYHLGQAGIILGAALHFA